MTSNLTTETGGSSPVTPQGWSGSTPSSATWPETRPLNWISLASTTGCSIHGSREPQKALHGVR